MGRARMARPPVTEPRQAEVERRLRCHDLAPRERERLELIKAVALGYDLDQIAAWTGRSGRRIQYWLTGFATQGLATLADKRRSGRPVKATTSAIKALETAVPTAPHELKLPFDVWTSARLSASPSLPRKPVFILHRVGSVPSSLNAASPAAAPNTPSHICKTHRRWGKKVQAEPERYALHHQDEPHLETTPT